MAWDDNWIYIHDTGVQTMRIQNFGSWSPYLVKDGRNVLGLEYTVDEGDESWNAPDDDAHRAGQGRAGPAGPGRPGRGGSAATWCACPRPIPYYDADYKANVEVIRAWLDEHAANVFPVGRNGMHRYNNQDHSMYTAMLTVENLLGADHDVWSVNVEEEYHEIDEARPQRAPGSATPSGTGRDAPVLPRRPARS